MLRLRLLREGHGLSQEQLGQRIGIPQEVYSLIESGRLKPSPRQAELLEDFLGESIGSLLKPWKPRRRIKTDGNG